MMKTIKPLVKPIVTSGRISYEESSRAYTLIRFKRRIIDEFPQLQTSKKWQYQLEYCRTYPATLKRIEQAQTLDQGIPLLLFIYLPQEDASHE
ncbi:MAG: hypothetical protein Q7K45_01825 [Nanoarchaeota archaeon]|nr:hypothetical protein [Nanoarchaeota archaeon]